jgi:hypothetical protein
LPDNFLECLYPTAEIGYAMEPTGLCKWKVSSGREFCFFDGIVYVMGVCGYLPLSRVPDWQAGIQFSCGFDAGRIVTPLIGEAPEK